MDKALVRDYLQKALAELDRPDTISTPDQLDRALSLGTPLLVLSNSFIYPAPLTLTKPVVLCGESYISDGVRMAFDQPGPKFLGGLTTTGPKVFLKGIEISNTNILGNIVSIAGVETRLDKVRIVGNPLTGSHRGIFYSGSFGFITNCWIDDIFQPAQDTQAIYSQDMGPGGLFIDNCMLRAAGESVMFGGGDPFEQMRTPSGITLTNSTLTKKPEWVAMTNGKHAQQVKNALEFKNCIGAKVDNCIFEYAGISQGQGGYLILGSPRNQGGTAPYSTVQDITISNCVGRFASGVVSFLGSDNVNPSQTLTNFVIKDCTFTDMDHNTLPGTTGRLFGFDRGPKGVVLQNISIAGANIKSIGYFTSQIAPTGFVVSNVTVDNGGVAIPYRWKLDGNTHPTGVNWPTNVRAALLAYMPDASLDASVF